ncbi:hypothetical protein E2C01_042370 [Portunus trituberculatus]|uniref:Uncharacterized protein n=1 Tax=Portunus trituberculatus TaxID=210409 RepID=A0A5B7FWB7_PORTR|nr:hypothetical protein [Portunus trituberculatus]
MLRNTILESSCTPPSSSSFTLFAVSSGRCVAVLLVRLGDKLGRLWQSSGKPPSVPASRCRPCPGTLDGPVSIENRLRDSYVKQYSFE